MANNQPKATEEKVSERLIRLGKQGNYFFNDGREPFVCIDVASSCKVVKVRSRTFSNLLLKRYFDETGTVPQSEVMNQTKSFFEASASFSENVHPVFSRVGERAGKMFYDLNHGIGKSIVEVSTEGWNVIGKSPVHFLSPSNMASQVMPLEGGGDVRKLLKHVRFKSSADKILYLVYVISCFVHGIPHPILILCGEKGAAKSTSTRMTRSVVDPAHNEVTSMPTSIQDLALSLQNNYMPAYDNLTSITGNVSDLLCTAATGGGFSKRKMFTDDEEAMMSFKRCVVLNGINVVASKADLLDRSIILELDRIDERERKVEREVWNDFDKDKPTILSGIFTVLSKAMKLYPSVQLDDLPRMADFTLWGYAIAEAIKEGWGEKFIRAYKINRKKASDEAASAHPVASALISMMKNTGQWQGSVTELLDRLENVAYREKIDTRNKLWPRAPHALSRRVNEIKSNLKECGITVTIRHNGDFKQATVENANKLSHDLRNLHEFRTEPVEDSSVLDD